MSRDDLTSSERTLLNEQIREHKCEVCLYRRQSCIGIRCAKKLVMSEAWAPGWCQSFALDDNA